MRALQSRKGKFRVHIHIFQDIVCPWCRIGIASLLGALQEWQAEEVTLHYHAFTIDPYLPNEGVPFRATMERLLGRKEQVGKALEYVTAMGQEIGLHFCFDQIKIRAHPDLAHSLLKLTPLAQQTSMLQTLQRAYFEEGLDIGNIEVILQIADIFGLDKHEVEEKLQSGRMAIYLQSDYELAEHYEVKAVPFFVINHSLIVTGAQTIPTFLQALKKVTCDES
ncbi:DsbA family oxidoreductase [Brevibacillus laterosporus]|uniref:DsbA family oxidoreductase n=2 Tax=Brevibacillus laterosporus TaxID=1465 RepID=A0AAP8QE71_BRELA|nr:DsbA family oxidoreductase [Brevibacillus laterosporus]